MRKVELFMDGGLEQPQIDEIEYLKLTDELKREMPDLLTDIKNPLDGFKKDEYESRHFLHILRNMTIFYGR